MLIICNGSFAGQLNSSCPTIHQRRVCSSYGDSVGSCFLHSNSSIEKTVCRCYFPALGSRRLLNDSEGMQSIGAVLVLRSFVGNVRNQINSAGYLNADDIAKEYTVLVTIGTLAMLIVSAFYAAQRADVEDSRQKNFKSFRPKNPKSFSSPRIGHMKSLRSDNPTKTVLSYDCQEEMAIWEESLPKIFSSQPFSERLYGEMKQHHKWLGIVFHYSETFSRSLRVLALSTKIIIMLFIQSLTYDYTSPDDGSCGSIKTRVECLEEKSSFATGHNKCSWQSGSCSFVQPSEDFKIIIYVTIFSTLISVPIEYILNSIILLVLVKPLKSYKVEVDDQRVDHNLESTPGEMNSESPEVVEQMQRLSREIQQHRLQLPSEHRREFDGTVNSFLKL